MTNRFIADNDDVMIVPEDSQCKSCVYRNKSYSEGYRNGACSKYPGTKEDYSDLKPKDILFKNKKCEFYKKEE